MTNGDAGADLLVHELVLRGRRALVSCAANGVGRELAIRLAASGAEVAVNASHDADREGVVETIRAEGGTAFGVAGSIATAAGCAAMWRECTSRFGRIDVLINSGSVAVLAASPANHNAEIWEAGVLGPLRLMAYASDDGMRSPGSIINIGTMPRIHGDPNLSLYRTAQAALISASRTLAATLAADGIRVNVIATQVQEANVAQVMHGPLLAVDDALISPGELTQVTDVVGTALYLASETSAPTTGTVFVARWR